MSDHESTMSGPVAGGEPPGDEVAEDRGDAVSEHTGPLSTSLDALVGKANRIAARAPSMEVAEIGLADDYEGAVGELLAERRMATWRRSIPQRYHRATIDDVKGGLSVALWDRLADWSRRPGGRNLVIGGPIGAGKTHAAIAACRIAHMDRGMDVRYLPAVELMAHLRPGADGLTWDDIVDVDLLIIDDPETLKPSEWTDETLYSIVNRRWLEELPTVVTSNLSPSDMQRVLGPRVYSRLAGGAVVITMTGKDRRMADAMRSV